MQSLFLPMAVIILDQVTKGLVEKVVPNGSSIGPRRTNSDSESTIQALRLAFKAPESRLLLHASS